MTEPIFCGDEDPESFAGEPVPDPWDEPDSNLEGGDDDAGADTRTDQPQV